MSEAKVRAMRDTMPVTVDLNEPVLSMPPSDRRFFSINPYALNFCDDCEVGAGPQGPFVIRPCESHLDPKNAVARAVRSLLNEVVQVAYNNAMLRPEGQIWAAWRVHLDEIDEKDGSGSFSLPFGHVRWLDKHVSDEKNVKVRAGLVQWREAVVDYFETVKREFDRDTVRPLPGRPVAELGEGAPEAQAG